ncbi:flavin monoamine oxidase family protein [Bernardetia sp. OM2101]|uniref:flavin monoamine oxidase family protein n=1 Tax=Bernardetia sp. OM2101 TaxID=3344876 RepID=UPI0035CFEED0
MDRRNFLKQSALVSLGGLLLPSTFLSSCSKDTLFEETDYDGKVTIIGAGAAGLYAAYVLKSKGIDFEILEASNKYGGRVGKLDTFANFPIDLGAQWMHGTNTILGDIALKSKTKITVDESEAVFWFQNQLVESLPKDISIFSGEDLPDVSYQEYASQKGFGEEYKYIVENIAGDQGAAAARLSAKYNGIDEEKLNSGDDDLKFEETFFDFIDREIAVHVKDKIQLNTIVKKIDYSSDKISITDSNNSVYTTDKVIITVPITILQDGDIEFSPVLPSAQTAAFNKIGMDAGMKVFMKFSSRFYEQNIIGGEVCAAYADDSVGKSANDNVLLGFVMGIQAEELTALGSDEAIVNALLAELDTMYEGQATASFIDSHVENWTTNPFVKGAYSYSSVGIGDARKEAAKPVNDKLFFAGEAMAATGYQSVQGAVETGYREVINLLNTVKK